MIFGGRDDNLCMKQNNRSINFFSGTTTDTSRRGLLDLLTNELMEQSEMQIMSATLWLQGKMFQAPEGSCTKPVNLITCQNRRNYCSVSGFSCPETIGAPV